MKKLPGSFYADNEPTVMPRSWVMLDVMVMFEKTSLVKDVCSLFGEDVCFHVEKMFKTTLHVDSIMRMTHYKVLGQFFGPEVGKHFNQKEPLHFVIN